MIIDTAADALTDDLSDFVFSHLQRVLEMEIEATGLVASGYALPADTTSFECGVQQLDTALAIMNTIETALFVLQNVLEAHRSYYRGEISFFQEDFAQAQKHYEASVQYISQGLLEYKQVSESAEANTILSGLASHTFYYQVLVLEALVSSAERDENWELALDIHYQEIALTLRALQALGEDESLLGMKIRGHVWYARRGKFECLAHLAERRGDITLRDHYLEQAREANRRSVELNTFWEEYDHGKNAQAT